MFQMDVGVGQPGWQLLLGGRGRRPQNVLLWGSACQSRE